MTEHTAPTVSSTGTPTTEQVWFTPRQAAPLLDMDAQTVRELCADRRIERRVSFGPAGQPRYKLHRDAIRAYIRQELAA